MMKSHRVKVLDLNGVVVCDDAEITIDERDDTATGGNLSWNGYFNDRSVSLGSGSIYEVEFYDLGVGGGGPRFRRAGKIRIESTGRDGTRFVSNGALNTVIKI